MPAAPSVGYHAAGFDVTGVDLAAQPYYPFPFVQADALTLDSELLAGFDVIHASPPCQLYSTATPAHRRAAHPDLVGPVRNRLVEAVASRGAAGGPWAYVIENVPGAPLANPVTVCGDSLRLGVRRHRLFESNVPLTGTPCWHDRTAPPVPVYGSYGQRGRRNPHELDGNVTDQRGRHGRGAGRDGHRLDALARTHPSHPTRVHVLAGRPAPHPPTPR